MRAEFSSPSYTDAPVYASLSTFLLQVLTSTLAVLGSFIFSTSTQCAMLIWLALIAFIAVAVGNCAAGVQRIYIRIESHEVMCTITRTISLDLPGNGTHCIYQRMQANPPEVTATLLEVTRKELYRKR